MLNEIREFEEYTYPLDTEQSIVRLKHQNICNKLSGIGRAMTIIARRSLSIHRGPDSIAAAKNDLQVWCGDPSGNPEKASEGITFGWLQRYIIEILFEEKALEFESFLMETPKVKSSSHYREICDMYKHIRAGVSIETFRKAKQRKKLVDETTACCELCVELNKELGIGGKDGKKDNKFAAPKNAIVALDTLYSKFGHNSGFNEDLFVNDLLDLKRFYPKKDGKKWEPSPEDKKKKEDTNDFKKTTYEKIIADAIAAGPLKRYYLVCEHEDLSEIKYIQDSGKETTPFSKTQMKRTDSNKKKHDFVLKEIAAFMLEQEFRRAEDLYDSIVAVNNTDMANWMVSTPETAKVNRRYQIAGRPLFLNDMIANNVTRLGIDKQWMESCGWRVIEEGNLDAYLEEHPEAVFYSDAGCGQYLQKNIRYT